MKKESFFRILENLLVIGLLSFFYIKDLATVQFHIDESHWIGTSYMFEAYFKGEFWSDAWRDNQHTVTNPPVPRYVIGVSRFMAGYRIPDLNRAWNYKRNVNFNKRMGAMPSENLLWWSRLPMAILAVFSIWMGFLFIKKMGGRTAAYIWLVIGIASPFFLLQTRRAMAEAPILFFVMLAAFLCYRALKNLDDEAGEAYWKVYVYLMLSGLCIGLAAEAKMNGLSVLAGVVVATALVIWKKREALGKKIRAVAFLSVLVAFATAVSFFGSYPYLWPDLLGRSVHVFQNRIEEMKYQSNNHASDAIETLDERLTIIPMRIFNDYALFNFNGAFLLNGILTIMGIAISLAQIRIWFKTGKDGIAAVTILAVAATASIPSFFTLIDWDRYYLFPVFFSSMAIAIGLGWLLQRVYTLILRVRTVHPTS